MEASDLRQAQVERAYTWTTFRPDRTPEGLFAAVPPRLPPSAVALILASSDGYLQSYGSEDLHVDIGAHTMDVTLWHSQYYGCDSGTVTRLTYRFTLATAEFRTVENTPVYVPTLRLCTD